MKLPAYQRISSVQEVLYVETQHMGATVYRREDGGWQTIFIGPTERLQLRTVGLDIPLAKLYQGIPGLSTLNSTLSRFRGR